jgi:hypothetical protein
MAPIPTFPYFHFPSGELFNGQCWWEVRYAHDGVKHKRIATRPFVPPSLSCSDPQFTALSEPQPPPTDWRNCPSHEPPISIINLKCFLICTLDQLLCFQCHLHRALHLQLVISIRGLADLSGTGFTTRLMRSTELGCRKKQNEIEQFCESSNALIFKSEQVATKQYTELVQEQ